MKQLENRFASCEQEQNSQLEDSDLTNGIPEIRVCLRKRVSKCKNKV